MKFNLFLLLLATLLAVGSPQNINPGLYHIQDVSTNTYWAMNKAPHTSSIRLEAEGAQWEISTAGKSSYTISNTFSHPKLSLTYQGPGNLLALSNAATTSPNLRWKFIPHGKNVVIQPLADPDSTQYVNKVHSRDGYDYLISMKSDTQPAVWRLISVDAF